MNDVERSIQLAAYADGELNGGTRERVEEMLAESAECREELKAHQDLRLRVHYVVSSEPVPEGLRDRIVSRLRALAAARGWRRLLTPSRMALAAAAVLLLAVGWRMMGGSGGSDALPAIAAVEIAAEEFAVIHQRCANERRHDEFKLGDTVPAVASNRVLQRVRFAVAVPDLSSRGYALHGVCSCSPQAEVQVVHAFYRPDAGDADTLSLFSTNPPVRLRASDGTTPGARSKRVYELARTDGVQVLKWDEAGGSFALCSRIDSAEALCDLAESIHVIEKRSPLSIFATVIVP
jgi:anti-sigma factor RsiW